MIATPPLPGFVWLLGREPYQRLFLKFWLVTSGIYALMLGAHMYGEHQQLVDVSQSGYIRWLIPAVLALFYFAMRSGWSLKLADPALTMPQMAFALLMLGQAHASIPVVRGVILIVMPLVLLFGAFTLQPAQCRRMAWFAVVLVAIDGFFVYRADASGANLRLQIIIFLICAVVLLVSGTMAGRLSRMRFELRSQKNELESALQSNLQLARQDALTGLPNRRHAQEVLAYEERRAHRQKIEACVILIDLDRFKSINDSFGHAAGDDVLRLFAGQSSLCFRMQDMLARWGGEEFLVLMPDTPLQEGTLVLERLRAQLAHPKVWQDRPELQATFSAGIVAYRTGETMAESISRADAALYQAKLKGRDRIEQG
jgi:diguanylate cyclase